MPYRTGRMLIILSVFVPFFGGSIYLSDQYYMTSSELIGSDWRLLWASLIFAALVLSSGVALLRHRNHLMKALFPTRIRYTYYQDLRVALRLVFPSLRRKKEKRVVIMKLFDWLRRPDRHRIDSGPFACKEDCDTTVHEELIKTLLDRISK